MRHATTFTIPTIAIAVSLFGIAGPARAQSGIGVLVGAVHDSANAAISGARVDLVGTAVAGVVTSPDGSFRLVNIPAGPRTVVVHRLGFAPDSARVEIAAGGEGKDFESPLAFPGDIDRPAEPGLAPPLGDGDGDLEPTGRQRAELAAVSRLEIGVGEDEDSAHQMRNAKCEM